MRALTHFHQKYTYSNYIFSATTITHTHTHQHYLQKVAREREIKRQVCEKKKKKRGKLRRTGVVSGEAAGASARFFT